MQQHNISNPSKRVQRCGRRVSRAGGSGQPSGAQQVVRGGDALAQRSWKPVADIQETIHRRVPHTRAFQHGPAANAPVYHVRKPPFWGSKARRGAVCWDIAEGVCPWHGILNFPDLVLWQLALKCTHHKIIAGPRVESTP